MLRKLNE